MSRFPCSMARSGSDAAREPHPAVDREPLEGAGGSRPSGSNRSLQPRLTACTRVAIAQQEEHPALTRVGEGSIPSRGTRSSRVPPSLRDRPTAGRLALNQAIGVRIPVPKSPTLGARRSLTIEEVSHRARRARVICLVMRRASQSACRADERGSSPLRGVAGRTREGRRRCRDSSAGRALG